VEPVANDIGRSVEPLFTRGINPPTTVDKSGLTPREVEVLRLLADGLTTKAIAARLGVTFKTAACHRFRILQKLDVESTVSAVRWAIRQGIVDL
jgi:DNA-binding NarL/FixJ family response regulator